MRLEQLQYLITISQNPSLSAAAEKLHLTPQALSMSITAMEKELDLVLLNRSFKGVSLTEDGRQVMEAAETFLGTLGAIHAKSRGHKAAQLTGMYEILTAHGEFNLFFLDFLTQAANDLPNCTVRVRPTAYHDIKTQLTADIYHLATTYSCQIDGQSLFKSDPDLYFEPLFACRLLALTPRSLPLAVYKTVSIKSLLDQPLIIYQPDTNDLPLELRIIQHFGAPKRLMMHTSSPLCHNMIQRGQGIGLTVQPIFQQNSRLSPTNDIVIQTIRDDVQITFGLLAQQNRPQPPEVQFLSQYLKDFAAALT